jgi:hypothetical protein
MTFDAAMSACEEDIVDDSPWIATRDGDFPNTFAVAQYEHLGE